MLWLFKTLFDKIGQLLTGDINLNFRWEDIRNHFWDLLQNDISIVQIPHHGAKRNWDVNLLNTIKDDSMWIISAGISNKYGHPHVSVVDDVVNKGRYLCWSNEINKVNIEGSVRW
jgi:competence protein ComEC